MKSATKDSHRKCEEETVEDNTKRNLKLENAQNRDKWRRGCGWQVDPDDSTGPGLKMQIETNKLL